MRAGLGTALAETWGRDDTVGRKTARSRVAVTEGAVCVLGRCSRLADGTVETDAIETSRDGLEFLSRGTHVKVALLKLEKTKLLFSLPFFPLNIFDLFVLDLRAKERMISLHVVRW